MTDPIRCSIAVPVSPDAAFERFLLLSSWWVPEYTWSGDALEQIGIEPREGGMCFELGPYGFRCDWGRVVDWRPPERLAFTWQISPRREPVPDPARASEVVVTFSPSDGAGTHVAVEHRDFERHGPEAAEYREALGSDAGWPLLLDGFARSLGGGV